MYADNLKKSLSVKNRIRSKHVGVVGKRHREKAMRNDGEFNRRKMKKLESSGHSVVVSLSESSITEKDPTKRKDEAPSNASTQRITKHSPLFDVSKKCKSPGSQCKSQEEQIIGKTMEDSIIPKKESPLCVDYDETRACEFSGTARKEKISSALRGKGCSMFEMADCIPLMFGEITKRKVPQNPGKIIPHEHDVLCGRGSGAKNHEGNIIYRLIVKKRKQSFQSCCKKRKRLLATSIVESIRKAQNPPGRFLEKSTNNHWNEIKYEAAIKKTMQALREARVDQGSKSKERNKHTCDNEMSDVEQGTRERHEVDGSNSSVTSETESIDAKQSMQDKDQETEDDWKKCTDAQAEHTTNKANFSASPVNALFPRPSVPLCSDTKPKAQHTEPARELVVPLIQRDGLFGATENPPLVPDCVSSSLGSSTRQVAYGVRQTDTINATSDITHPTNIGCNALSSHGLSSPKWDGYEPNAIHPMDKGRFISVSILSFAELILIAAASAHCGSLLDTDGIESEVEARLRNIRRDAWEKVVRSRRGR